MVEWLMHNWMTVVLPLFVLVAATALGMMVRLVLYKAISQQINDSGRQPIKFVFETVWHPIINWFQLMGIYIVVQFLAISPSIKPFADKGLVSLFTISLAWTTITLASRFIRFYLVKAPAALVPLALNAVRITISVLAILVLLDTWGAPTQTATIILIAAFLGILILVKDIIPDIVARIHLANEEYIKIGQLIKLESGEMGFVIRISLMKTTISDLAGNLIIVPNQKLMRSIITNYLDGQNIADSNTETKPHDSPQTSLIELLTTREREVLSLIAKGASNREIAQRLFLSEHTVKSHLRSIFSKLNINNRQQAVVYALEKSTVIDSKTA